MTESALSLSVVSGLHEPALALFDVAVVVDGAGMIIGANAGARTWLGPAWQPGASLESAEAEGYPEGVPSAATVATWTLRQILAVGGSQDDVVAVCACGDGQQRTLRWRGNSLRHDAGQVAGAMVVAEALPDAVPTAEPPEYAALREAVNGETSGPDVENGRLEGAFEASRAELRATLDAFDAGVVLVGTDGRIVMANRACRELLGLQGDPAGQDLQDLQQVLRQRFADPEAFDRLQLPPPLSTDVTRTELVLSSPRRIVQRTGAPVRNESGAVAGRIITYVDITELRDLDRVKDEFISAAAHELRSPLTTVAGYSQLLQRRLAPLAQMAGEIEERTGVALEQALEFTATLVTEASRLSRLISVLLDVSRIQAGRFEVSLRPLDVARVAPMVIERLRSTLLSHPIGYDGPGRRGLTVLGNEERMEQLLTNLVENAARYSQAGSPITVRLERQQASRRLQIMVQDRGIGVLPEDRERLFERAFRSAEAAARAPGGMGIGLYLCRGIVQQMDGTIWCESPGPGQGSTFIVSLPLVAHEGEGEHATEG